MSYLRSRIKFSGAWEELARTFFGHWEDVGFGNLDKTKLEALLIYCLHSQGILPANGFRVSLSEAVALNKDPAEIDRFLVKGFTLFHKDLIDTQQLIDAAVRCLVSSADRVINGSLEFHCSSLLDSRYVSELFERCGINPEQGRNSKILQVDLSTIDSSRINTIDIYNDLCTRLGISIPVDPMPSDDKGSGGWFVECLKLSKTEIAKVSIAVVVRELLSSLVHGAQ